MNRIASFLFVLTLALGACTADPQTAAADELLRSLPKSGAVLSQPVQMVQLWFKELPAPDKSELTIEGPSANAKVVGLHTMGENDLMAMIRGDLPDGDYQLIWTIADSQGTERKGTVPFTIKRAAEMTPSGG